VLRVRESRGKEVLVPGLLLLALAVIGLVALLEKGPLHILTAPGAYPGNNGPLGTSILYQKLRENYTVIPVTSWSYIRQTLNPCNLSVVAIIVSPETSYTDEDLESINYLKGSCRKFSLLIADEGVESNRVLESIGSKVRISGAILQPYTLVANLSTPWGWSGRVLLDKASRVNVVQPSGDAIPIGFVEILATSVAVAYYENVNGVEVVVVGDGSIFLNQVLDSNIGEYPLSFIRSTVSHLCGELGNCVVLMEASKYMGLDPVEVLRSGDKRVLGLLNMIDLVLSLIAKLVHPSTWLPPLLNIVNHSIRSLIELNPYFKGLIIVVGAIIVMLVVPRERRVKDSMLEDVAEIDWYGFGEFRRHLVSHGAKLTKQDFITLYDMVNTILRSTTGSTLEDPQLPSVLEAIGVSRGEAEAFRGFMVKYYRRATGKTLWPPLVMWGRITRKAIMMCEKILEPLGASITRPSKLELIAERGLRSSGGS
jgi:hypothetical protein